MDEKEKPEVIFIRERAWESLVSDAGTFAMFSALIGIGWMLESQAMQWVGAVCGFISVVTVPKKWDIRLSVAEARRRLDEIEADQH